VAEKLQGNQKIFIQCKRKSAQNNSEKILKEKSHHIPWSYIYILIKAYTESLSKLLMPGQPLWLFNTYATDS